MATERLDELLADEPTQIDNDWIVYDIPAAQARNALRRAIRPEVAALRAERKRFAGQFEYYAHLAAELRAQVNALQAENKQLREALEEQG